MAVGAGVVLYKYSRGDNDIQQFANLFNEAIVPAANRKCLSLISQKESSFLSHYLKVCYIISIL